MLVEDLKVLLGTTYSLYVKAQGFHWNVSGPNFPQYHDFFGKLYEEIYGSIDELAEMIRQLDAYSPGSMSRFLELSVIDEQLQIPRANLMFQELFSDVEIFIDLLNRCFASANDENEQGIADFIAGRISAMKKHRWMIRSILEQGRD